MTRYALDIDSVLDLLEKTILRYYDLPQELRFVKGRREPLNKSSDYKDVHNQSIENKPFHPFLSAYIAREAVMNYLYHINPTKELLYTNPIAQGILNNVYVTKYFTEFDMSKSYFDIITSYVPDINRDDLYTVESYLRIIIEQVSRYIAYRRHSLCSVNVDTQYFILEVGEDIRAVRYEEFIKLKEIEMRCDHGT